MRWLRSNDVHCTPMILTEPDETPSNRLGTYYLETGYGVQCTSLERSQRTALLPRLLLGTTLKNVLSKMCIRDRDYLARYDVPAREAVDVCWAQTCMTLEDTVEELNTILSPVDVYKRQSFCGAGGAHRQESAGQPEIQAGH